MRPRPQRPSAPFLPASSLLAAAAAAVSVGAAETAAGRTPDLTWRGAERLGVYCQIRGTPADQAVQTDICERLARIAAEGAPMPVVLLPAGDPGLREGRTVALLAHFAIQPSGSERLLVFTLRPWRAMAESPTLFGSAPRAAPLPASGAETSVLDEALRAALSDVLPWRAPQTLGRQLRQ